MRGPRGIVAGLSVALTLVLIGSLIIGLLALTAPEGQACFLNYCAQSEHLRQYLAIAALSGLVLLILLQGQDAGAASGAGVVMLGLAAAAAMAPEIHVSAGSGAAQAGDDDRLSARLERTIGAAEEIALDDDFGFGPADILIVNSGLGAVRFTIGGEETVRLRIDVSIEGDGDPMFEVFREYDDGGRERLARDDDGGSGVSSRVEGEFEPGSYLLVMREISGASALSTGMAFTLEIKRVDLERLFEPDRTAALTLGGSDDCSGEGTQSRRCRLWPEQTVAALGSIDDADFYRLKLDTGGEDACLVVDVNPTNGGDTVAGLFDLDRSIITSNDDRGPDDLGTRIVLDVPADAPARHDVLLHVSAFDRGLETVTYSLYAELRPREAGGGCIESSAWSRP